LLGFLRNDKIVFSLLKLDSKTKPLALMVVEILFCVDIANLSLTKREAKKIAADSRFPAPGMGWSVGKFESLRV